MNKTAAKLIGGIFSAIILVVIVILLIANVYRIPAGYAGVLYNINGGIEGDVLETGWHLTSPMQKVKLFTVGNEQIILTKDKREGSESNDSFRVSTSDDASVAISFQMTYRFVRENIPDTYSKFKGMSGEDIVEKRVKSVLKARVSEITTDYTIMDIYSGNRSEINTKLTDYLDKEFRNMYGIEVIDASIIDCHPDKQLKEAINARVEAIQKKQKAEADQAAVKVEAETKLIEAQNEADIKLTKAKADADAQKIAAEAEAEANKKLAASLTENLINSKLADARLKHGWVTIQGADTIVTDKK